MGKAAKPQMKAVQKPTTTKAPTGLLQRKCDRCRGKEKILQRSSFGTAPETAPRIVQEVLRSTGQPLDITTRSFMEPRFGHDFSQVRIHSGPLAAESARAVNALAYTVGSDVVFGVGPSLGDRRGQRLLAHELVHVVQQAETSGSSLQPLERGSGWVAAEAEADRVSQAILEDSWTKPSLLQSPDLVFGREAQEVQGSQSRSGGARFASLEDSGMRLPSHETVHSVQQSTSEKMIARQIFFDKTNYRFDTYQITAEDLKDPDITSRIKALTFSALIKYRDRVADPAVKDYIARLLLTSPPTSLEVAMGVSSGDSPIVIKTESGWTLKVLADAYTKDETVVPGGKAKTLLKMPRMLVRWTSRAGKVENIRVDKTFLIQTVYGSGTGRTSPSGYGSGTTEEDIKSEMTTLAHHEGSHAMDLIDFMMDNPPPRFGGREGMNISRAEKAALDYKAAMDDYMKKALEYSSKKTDCVGAESGLPICRQPP